MNNLIETKDFCCLDKFSEEAIGKLVSSTEEFGSVSIIACGDVAQELIKKFLSVKVEIEDCGIVDFDLGAVTFEPEHWDGYDKEYILSLTSDFELWCEPLWRDNQYGVGYINVESEAVYVHEDCNYSVLKKIDSKDVTIFSTEE